jgi:hypothetical protein
MGHSLVRFAVRSKFVFSSDVESIRGILKCVLMPDTQDIKLAILGLAECQQLFAVNCSTQPSQ